MRHLLAFIGLLLLASCSALPEIRNYEGVEKKNIAFPAPFLRERARLIHAIEVKAAGRTQTVLLGVTLADPALRTISCALMSIEGLVLFEAAADAGGLKVSRALPPLDSESFARAMMEDIELILFTPPGRILQRGFLPEGEPVCRWPAPRGGTIDALASPDGAIVIRRYAEGGRLKRDVRLTNAASPYSIIELQAFETVNYALKMDLIEFEANPDEPREID